MSLGSAAPSARCVARFVAPALGAVLLLTACFDSDEKYAPAAVSTSTTGPLPMTSDSSTSTSGSSSTTEGPDKTCRDAISCVVGCAAQLQLSMLPEPDFTCFLECEEGLDTQQVLDLFRLTECITDRCIAADQCDLLVPTPDTTSGGESSTGSDTDGTRPPLCLNCVLGGLLDADPPGCIDVARDCQ